MRKKATQWIKSQDLVGYQVNLSYNGKGNLHQTFLGGFISSIVLAFMLYTTYGKSSTMVTHGDDSITKITQLMSEENLAQNISMVENRM